MNDLFETPVIDRGTPEQVANIQRVRGAIAPIVLEYLRTIGEDASFTAGALTRYVAARSRAGGAPGSACRILRDLRRRGLVDYDVIDRRASRYKLTRLS